MTEKTSFIPYSDAVETIQLAEAETFGQIAATMVEISTKVGQRQRHTVRSVHAKSHGLLKAEFTILPGLDEQLRQGLFAQEKSYGAVMRFSTNPGDILSDHISTPRGLAIKIIGVPHRAGHPGLRLQQCEYLSFAECKGVSRWSSLVE